MQTLRDRAAAVDDRTTPIASSSMRISQLAKAANVGVETVRYYQRIGLFAVPRSSGATHRYDDEDVRHLRFIKQAEALGFSLSEVAELLRLSTLNCADAQRLTKKYLDSVRTKILCLARLENVLEHVTHQCQAGTSVEARSIIKSLVVE